MAASRFLGAAAARIRLLSLQLRVVSCIGVAVMVIVQDFLYFGVDHFPFNIPFKSASKSTCFLLWRLDPVVELQFL